MIQHRKSAEVYCSPSSQVILIVCFIFYIPGKVAIIPMVYNVMISLSACPVLPRIAYICSFSPIGPFQAHVPTPKHPMLFRPAPRKDGANAQASLGKNNRKELLNQQFRRA